VTYISLSFWDVAAVSVFVLVNGLLSLWLSLGIERQLLVATIRMVIQLSAVGAVLTLLFGVATLPWTLAMAGVMVLFAGHEITARQKRPLAGWWGYGLGTSTMTLAAASLTAVALLGILQPHPWFEPRYAIPLLGMILGNAMTGIALGLDTLTTAAVRERPAIETRIALGATRLVALRAPMQEAMRRRRLPGWVDPRRLGEQVRRCSGRLACFLAPACRQRIGQRIARLRVVGCACEHPPQERHRLVATAAPEQREAKPPLDRSPLCRCEGHIGCCLPIEGDRRVCLSGVGQLIGILAQPFPASPRRGLDRGPEQRGGLFMLSSRRNLSRPSGELGGGLGVSRHGAHR
jgi:putative ABC transport system permease protein